jgi:hypothetical protein
MMGARMLRRPGDKDIRACKERGGTSILSSLPTCNASFSLGGTGRSCGMRDLRSNPGEKGGGGNEEKGPNENHDSTSLTSEDRLSSGGC